MQKEWKNCTTTAERWKVFKDTALKYDSKRKDSREGEHLITEVVFKFLYPRLDANVSKTVNHLLKSAFSLHPNTGRVCVPIENIRTFDPLASPTISQLLTEFSHFTPSDPSTDAASQCIIIFLPLQF